MRQTTSVGRHLEILCSGHQAHDALHPQEERVNAAVVNSQLPEAVSGAGELLRKSSSPEENLPRMWEQADLALLRCVDFVGRSEHTLERFFVPCADELRFGHPVALLGHAGAVL